jgi:hypothetical protein
MMKGMITTTRKDAIEQRLPEYFTGLPCKNGHIAKRYTRSGSCYRCIHPDIPAAGQPDREARAQARKRMIVRKFRLKVDQVETFMMQCLGLALSYEPAIKEQDLQTRQRALVSGDSGIYPFRIFPEMEATLRTLEPKNWGAVAVPPVIAQPAEYWPEGDPR